MPKYFHNGDPNHKVEAAFKHIDGTHKVKVPDAFGGGLTDCHPGSVVVAAAGVGFWVVPPGGSAEIKLDAHVVKQLAPSLLTEEEWLAKNANPKTASKSEESAKAVKDKVN